MAPEVALAFQCGQLSLLETYDIRVLKGFSNAGTGEPGKAAQEQMLKDLWLTAADLDTPFSTVLKKMQGHLTDGNDEKFHEELPEARALCAANGTMVSMSFLPGEGG